MQKTQFWLGTKRILRTIWSYIGWEDGIALLAIAIGVAGYFHRLIPFFFVWTDLYLDMRSNLIALGITVLIIDNVNEVYRRRAERERLILQMGSPDHVFAIEAVRQLRARGWLYDGSLRKAKLNMANLHDIDLQHADLHKADLHEANLNGAFLIKANLSGANLCVAKLRQTYLQGANLRKASLETNLRETRLSGAKYDSNTIWPDDFDPVAAGCVKDQEGEQDDSQ